MPETARVDGLPLNLNDLCDVALGHRFEPGERRAARIELSRLYGRCAQRVMDPLGDLLTELAAWAEARLFDDDQDPDQDTPDERVVRAYGRWRALR